MRHCFYLPQHVPSLLGGTLGQLIPLLPLLQSQRWIIVAIHVYIMQQPLRKPCNSKQDKCNESDRNHNLNPAACSFQSKLHLPGASPHELIMQESLRHLITEVIELRERCESSEVANAQLLDRMNALEQAFCDQIAQAPLTRANLTGYASSEGSSGDETVAAPYGSAANNERFNAVALILEQYDKRLETYAASQAALERQVAELNAYQKSSQALFRSLKLELDGDLDTRRTLGSVSSSLEGEGSTPPSTVKSKQTDGASVVKAAPATSIFW
ncbi:hypothetical protein BAUCODRAFT_181145 [Baudoinia panamericana UAMH 10762]|uniref:Uncharacterized protein n=1 Tax=Baudoinia panamericana (strain UAMH 10762) TaxID=717646 RepID=M2M119_BAUPA|nr:uncharacterized protein BAUCODRAFT_181145 [Baudoinia panamericana UAMH 10762]EMD00728.1 hypothetical protein BAUCODRAFT_181145 [Baudoinia panamericana UAMH 10762]